MYLAKAVITAGSQNVRPVVDEGDRVYVVVVRVDSKMKLEFHVQKCGRIASKSAFCRFASQSSFRNVGIMNTSLLSAVHKYLTKSKAGILFLRSYLSDCCCDSLSKR